MTEMNRVTSGFAARNESISLERVSPRSGEIEQGA